MDAIAKTLDALNVSEPAVFVGHSTGTLLALRMAAFEPVRVAGIVAVSPPIYPTTEEARSRVGASSFMTKLFVMRGPLPKVMCRMMMCKYRESAGRLAVRMRPDLPAPIARDGVEHNWASYSGTLEHVVLAAKAVDWIRTIDTPVRLVAGGQDGSMDRELLRDLAAERDDVTLVEWPDAAHDAPLSHDDELLDEVRCFIDGAAPPHREDGRVDSQLEEK